MKKTFCDIPGCHEEAYHEVDVCTGYTYSINDRVLKPFEKETVRRLDLCSKHYRLWLEATYNAFYEANKRE